MQFTVPSVAGGFYRKPYPMLVFKTHTKKSAKQESSSLFMKKPFAELKHEGRKPGRILFMRRLKFMTRSLDYKLPFKNSISG
jgi:hypothetical protein